MKMGIDEQEQNGVTVPRSAPTIFAPMPWNRPMIFRLRSGGKKLWIYEMIGCVGRDPKQTSSGNTNRFHCCLLSFAFRGVEPVGTEGPFGIFRSQNTTPEGRRGRFPCDKGPTRCHFLTQHDRPRAAIRTGRPRSAGSERQTAVRSVGPASFRQDRFQSARAHKSPSRAKRIFMTRVHGARLASGIIIIHSRRRPRGARPLPDACFRRGGIEHVPIQIDGKGKLSADV